MPSYRHPQTDVAIRLAQEAAIFLADLPHEHQMEVTEYSLKVWPLSTVARARFVLPDGTIVEIMFDRPKKEGLNVTPPNDQV